MTVISCRKSVWEIEGHPQAHPIWTLLRSCTAQALRAGGQRHTVGFAQHTESCWKEPLEKPSPAWAQLAIRNIERPAKFQFGIQLDISVLLHRIFSPYPGWLSTFVKINKLIKYFKNRQNALILQESMIDFKPNSNHGVRKLLQVNVRCHSYGDAQISARPEFNSSFWRQILSILCWDTTETKSVIHDISAIWTGSWSKQTTVGNEAAYGWTAANFLCWGCATLISESKFDLAISSSQSTIFRVSSKCDTST